jgi:hypothetical protein
MVLKVAADLGNVLVHFGVEQRLGGDAQCQGHAVRVHVTQVAGLPVLEHTRGVPDHGVAVRGKPLGVKGRSSESALTMPKLAFAREQAAAEDRVDVAKEEGKLDEVVRVPDQHVLGVVGVVQQHGRPNAQAQGHDIPVLSRPFAVVAKSIASELQQVAEERQPLGSGRPTPARRVTSFRWSPGRGFDHHHGALGISARRRAACSER